jgi:hypothetical protein
MSSFYYPFHAFDLVFRLEAISGTAELRFGPFISFQETMLRIETHQTFRPPVISGTMFFSFPFPPVYIRNRSLLLNGPSVNPDK